MATELFEFDGSMRMVYMACAVGGGALLSLQTILLLFGLGDADADFDAADGGEQGGSFGVFSLRAIASFFTFFGLTGWLGVSRGWDPTLTVLAATAAGVALMLVVALLLRMQTRLQSQGNVDPRNAEGEIARVYLRIPSENQGHGKITVKVQGRSAEYAAFTNGPELPTGASVRVVRMTAPGTFEVVSLTEE